MPLQIPIVSVPSAEGLLRADAIQAVMLDLDGTLVDTLGDFCLALQHMLRDLPAPFSSAQLTPVQVQHWVGRGSEHLVQSVLESLQPGSSGAWMEQALARYQYHYGQFNGSQARVYPGVPQGLRLLRARGWPLACVTNKPTGFAKQLLEQLGLADSFAFTLGGDAVQHKKPHPEALLLACARLGSVPSRTLMVGDSRNDAQAAHAAGCPVLLMSYGYNHGQPVRTVSADAFADRLDQLPWRD